MLMIPKIIHYCWFGNNPKPKMVRKCIKSWKKYCPDYQIIEWNESNFDVNCCDYVKEAYEAKKWAFVSDYARLWIILNNGGIYLDTDVELIRNLDFFLKDKAFFGFEDDTYIATGLGFGAERKNAVVECMLGDYENTHFLKKDGSIDVLTCPKRNTKSIMHLMKDITDTSIVNKIDGAVLYPKEYFCPYDWQTKILHTTDNTYSIHHYSASWYGKDQQKQYRKQLKKIKKDYVLHMPNRVLRNILGNTVYDKLKKICGK